jgi:hypothetical protein
MLTIVLQVIQSPSPCPFIDHPLSHSPIAPPIVLLVVFESMATAAAALIFLTLLFELTPRIPYSMKSEKEGTDTTDV